MESFSDGGDGIFGEKKDDSWVVQDGFDLDKLFWLVLFVFIVCFRCLVIVYQCCNCKELCWFEILGLGS